MQKIIILCDVCGLEGAYRFAFVTGRESDHIGEFDDTYGEFDLCPACMHVQLGFIINGLDWEQRAVLTKMIRKDKKFYLHNLGSTEVRRGGFLKVGSK